MQYTDGKTLLIQNTHERFVPGDQMCGHFISTCYMQYSQLSQNNLQNRCNSSEVNVLLISD